MQINGMLVLKKECTQILKGIAILYVILGHMGYLDISGAWGVHIFLIVSGYGIYKSVIKNGLENYWKKRILSVYIPYFIYQIIALFVVAIVLDTPLTFSQVLFSVIGLDFGMLVDKTMWYISYAFYWYLTMWFFIKVKKSNLFLSYIILFLSTVFVAVAGYTNLVWGAGSISWAYCLSFPIGMVLAKLSVNNKYRKQKIYLELIILICLSAFFVADYGNVHRAFNEMFFSLSAAIITILLVILIPNIFLYSKNILQVIGIYSFGMYLSEGVLLKLQGLNSIVINKHISNILLLICCFLVAIVMDKCIVHPISNKLDKIWC